MENEIMNVIGPYAPILGLAVVFFLQAKVFATPAQLEAVHRQILEECHKQFVSAISFEQMRSDLQYVKGKLDKIYDRISGEVL